MAKKTTYELEVKLGASTSASWKTSLNNAEKSLESLNSLSNKIIAGIAAGVTAAAATATVAISSAVETYKGFEQEMATVKSISEATESEYLAMKEAAMDAGRSTVFTAEESASALEYMSLAGWSVQDSIEGLTPMLKLAAATGAELQTTSDLVTDSMNALGLNVSDMESYMNKLVAANNNANTTAEQLMEALVDAGGASRVLGASLDDTITSIGIFSNNGIKAEEAGTALNAIMVRLAGNSQAIKELANLNVDIWDDNGSFIGWKESLVEIEEAMSGLTDEEKALSLKKLAGTTHYTQFEYLLDSVRETADGTETAWDLLEEQVESSNGALTKMYDTTTDTLEFAQERLNSATEDMQIRLVDVFSDDAKGMVTWIADKIPEATDALVDFAQAHEKDFADAVEGLTDGIEALWENGISAFSWIIKNKGGITGAIKAVSAAVIGVKVAFTGIKIAQFFTNPLSAAVGVATLAITAIGAFKGHIEDLAEAAKDADLESRFGNISLSLSEIETVAKNIVNSDSLTGIADALSEFDELDTYQEKIDDAVETLDKLNWKVSIGIGLSDDDADSYKTAIESYSKAAQEYALQEQYAVQLSLSYAFDENDLEQSNIVSKVNSFYADKYNELADLGTQLNEALTEAFNDGLLDIDEIETISKIQKQMAEIQSALAEGEMAANLALIGRKYSGIDLDAGSFEELEQELAEQVESTIATYDEAFTKEYQALYSAYNSDGENKLTTKEFVEGVNALNAKYANLDAGAELNAVTFELNTINEAYGDILEQMIDDAIEKYGDSDTDWSERPELMWSSIVDEIYKNGIGNDSQDAISELLENMQPTIDSLYNLLENDWNSLDSDTQASLTNAIKNIEVLQTLANNDWSSIDSDMISSIGDIFENSEILQALASAAEGDFSALYKNIADYVKDSDTNDGSNIKQFVTDYYGELTEYAEPVIDEAYADTQDYINDVYGAPFSVKSTVDIELVPDYDESLMKSWSSFYSGNYSISKYVGTGIMSNADGGIYNSPILTTFAEEGPEAAIPLDGTDRAKSLWTKAGQILGMFQSGTRDSEMLNNITKSNGSPSDGGNMQISFNPVINIQGNASKDDVQSAMSLTLDDLREMIAEIQAENRRVAFG